MSFIDNVKNVLLKNSILGHTDKASYHAYEYFYPQALEFLQGRENINILEIGTFSGGSIKCWAEIFPHGHFYGIDHDLSHFDQELRKQTNIHLHQASQTDPALYNVFPGVEFDVIIDDASHQMHDQITSFDLLSNRLRLGGKYIIEDIYPHHEYPESFKSQFQDVDLRNIKSRGDDRLFVYTRRS